MSLWKRCTHRGRHRDACDHPWWSKVVVRGQRVQESLEQYFGRHVRGRGSKTLARDLDRQLHEDVLDGSYFDKRRRDAAMQIPKGGLTFDAFIPVYRDGYVKLKGLKSWTGDRRWKLGKMKRAWTGRRLQDIRIDVIETFLASLKGEGAKPSTVRRYYALIHQMFGWAELRGYIDRSPVRRGLIALEAENNERDRRPSADELQRILAHATPYLADVITVVLGTALRKGSLLKIQVDRIDWTRGQIDGANARHHGLLHVPSRALKNSKPLTLPMTARVREVLERRATALAFEPKAYLFGNEVGEVYASTTPITKPWVAALRAAGITVPANPEAETEKVDGDLHFHDLRGEAASRLYEMGVPMDTIRRFLGHSSLAMTQRYLRARVGDEDQVVHALEQWVPALDRREAAEHGEATKRATVVGMGRKTR